MRRARGSRSARQLCEQTEKLGYRVSPEIIAKLDSGHRGAVLNVTELLVLAAALDIPPALVLFPGYPDGEVEYLPGRRASAKAAAEWFAGTAPIPGSEDDIPSVGRRLVAAVHEFTELSGRFVDLAEMDIPEAALAAARQALVTQLNTVAAQMNELRRQLEGDNR
jgi:hypothetical protein